MPQILVKDNLFHKTLEILHINHLEDFDCHLGILEVALLEEEDKEDTDDVKTNKTMTTTATTTIIIKMPVLDTPEELTLYTWEKEPVPISPLIWIFDTSTSTALNTSICLSVSFLSSCSIILIL